MAKKRYPVQNRANVALANPGPTGIIKVDRFLSKLNKRLYRQGRFYQAKIDLELIQGDTGPVEVYVLRDTWGNQKAYQMAYDVFMSTTAEERARIGNGAIARWQDFRCQDGTGYQVMDPIVYDEVQAGSRLTIGEALDTRVEDKNGNTMVFTWGSGVAGTSYGIRAEYELKANTDDKPTTNAEDVPYDAQASDTSNVEIDQLRNRGNDAPYNSDGFGDAWTKVATLSRTPGQQKLSTGFFTAPCGFIVITGLSTQQTTNLHLTVKTGDYKGVEAPTMIDATLNGKQLGYASPKKWKSMGVSTR